MKEADETWKHCSPPQKSPNPHCAFPPWSPKYQAGACSVLYRGCRRWPAQSGYAPSEAPGQHSIIAVGFLIKQKLSSTESSTLSH